MQISHKEAQLLIQHKIDDTLPPGKQEDLAAHLSNCKECASYLNDARNIETILRSTMQKHWQCSTPSILTDVSRGKNQAIHRRRSTMLITRNLLASVAIFFSGLVLWQLTFPKQASINPNLFTAVPIPTPSIHLTNTKFNEDVCAYSQYTIQKGDTLESVAVRFATSKDIIKQLNNLHSDSVVVSTIILVPVCDLTPTETTHPPTLTFTPGGYATFTPTASN